MSNELQIVSEDALSLEERKELSLELDNLINSHKNNRQAINKLVFECVAAMSEADDATDKLAKKKGFSRFIGSISGSNKKLQDTININRAAAQYASQQCLQKLAEQNLMTFDLITAVNNKLNASLIKVDEEFNKIYEGLIKFFKKNRSELVRLESRLEKVERNVKLLNWQNSIEYQEFDDKEYIDLDPIDKIVCLTRDFYEITQGNWNTSDLLLLKTAMATVDLNPKATVNCYDALKTIAEDEVLLEKLFNSTELVAIEEPQYLVSASCIQKIYALGNQESYIVDAFKDYMDENNIDIDEKQIKDALASEYLSKDVGVSLNIEIGCFDFMLELLYNLQGYEDEIGGNDSVNEDACDSANEPINEDINENEPVEENVEEGNEEDSVLLVGERELDENYEKLKELAEEGNARAMYLLSVYFTSKKCDKKTGSDWLNKAVENGDPIAILRNSTNNDEFIDNETLKQVKDLADEEYMYACFELAKYYASVARNYDEAIRLYNIAGNKGSGRAFNNLATMYNNGDGVYRDHSEAIAIYKKGAELGNASAQYNLARMYSLGIGTNWDEEAAAKLYRKSAEQGNADAQYFLAVCYQCGSGVEKDNEEALKWFTKAAEQGHAEAQDYFR